MRAWFEIVPANRFLNQQDSSPQDRPPVPHHICKREEVLTLHYPEIPVGEEYSGRRLRVYSVVATFHGISRVVDVLRVGSRGPLHLFEWKEFATEHLVRTPQYFGAAAGELASICCLICRDLAAIALEKSPVVPELSTTESASDRTGDAE